MPGRPRWLARAAIALACASFLPLPSSRAAPSPRLERIRARGYVGCGIEPGVAGFAVASGPGRYAGFDVDICRALSAAIFGTPDKVRFTRAATVRQFLASPDIDVAARRLTWTLTREAGNGLLFGPIVFYDGQGFLVRRELGLRSAKGLAGRTICVQPDEGHDANLARWARANGLRIEEMVIEDTDAAARAFVAGRCDAYSADVTMLGSIRTTLPHPDRLEILPDMISKEPLAPLVRQGDDGFFELVRWTVFALIDAEELGVTSANADAMLESPDPAVRRLLGVTPGNGRALGVGERWAYQVIKSVGNYGEMYARDVGRKSPVGLARGLNRLWTEGGLLYAPPAR